VVQVDLERAVGALDAGDHDGALAALLDAWRALRVPRLAELVESCGRRAALAPIAGHDAWMAVAAHRDPWDLPRLVATSLDGANRFGNAVVAALLARGQELARWPADPRIGALVAEQIRRAGYEQTSSSTQPFWRSLLRLVLAAADPRSIEILQALDVGKILGRFSDRKKMRVWLQAELATTLEALRVVAVEPPLPRAFDKPIAAIAKQLRGGVPRVVARIAARDGRDAVGPATPRPAAKARRSTPAVRDPDESLRDALHALDGGDHHGALVALLEAWRACPSPEIAACVETTSRRLEASLPAIDGKTRKAIHAEWIRIARDRDPADLPRLLDAVTHTYGRATDALERVAAIAGWPADPRTAAAIVRQLRVPAFYTSSTKPFWTALLELAVAHGDPRAIDALGALAFDTILVREWADMRPMRAWFQRAVAGAVEQLRARHPHGPPAAPAGDSLAAIAARLDTGLDDRMLAEIAAHPDDLGLRAVYADHLQQRGDPRGELIALQLADREPERQRELIAKHGEAWLGPLAGVAVADLSRFAGGFLAAVTLASDAKPAEIAAVVGAPIWATVERLSLGHGDVLPVELLRHPVMARVVALEGASDEAARALLAWERVPYRTLGLSVAGPVDLRGLRRAYDRGALAALRVLAIHDHWPEPAQLRALWPGLGAQLERFAIGGMLDALGGWLAACPVREVELRRGDTWIRVDRGSRAADASISFGAHAGELAAAIAVLPRRHVFRTLRVAGVRLSRPLRGQLERACAKQSITLS
jgi:uncharacterized protein (TIGR02996 family)